jgi:hypothetical protein
MKNEIVKHGIYRGREKEVLMSWLNFYEVMS